MSFDEMEYEALQAEKRDKMNARWQVWSILVGLTGAFGLASLQTGATGYVIALYPVIVACLARFSAHSESVLDQIKRYLLEVENRQSHEGYEHFNRSQCRKSSGSHRKALRDAIYCTDLLASVVLIAHVYTDHGPLLAVIAFCLEIAILYKTSTWLRDEA